ncbi:hypothetical protein CRYUN_Cryun01aG0226700 [Craigia yunnanensis]
MSETFLLQTQSLQLCPKPKAKKEKKKNVFTKQTPRDGFDETVNHLIKFFKFSLFFFMGFILTLSWFLFTRMMGDYKVEMINDGMQEFYVHFSGPNDSPYHGGVWRIKVELPDAYPYKSPSIGFVNKIYHPNVDEMSGSVCLDVINQTWSPMFDLVNVFEVFLPQLLLYPNPSDPLNGEAAALMMRDRGAYEQRVKGRDSNIPFWHFL